MKKIADLIFVLVISLFVVSAASAYTYTDIIAQDAYNMLDPGNSTYNAHTYYLLDVRTPEEWLIPGHPGENAAGEGAFLEEPSVKVFNIPYKLKNGGTMVVNDLFVDEVLSGFSLDNYLIVMCASGGRSASASTLLDDYYAHVYNVLNGFSSSGGWKDSGLPYNQNPEGMWTLANAPAPPTLFLLGFGLAALAGRRLWSRNN